MTHGTTDSSEEVAIVKKMTKKDKARSEIMSISPSELKQVNVCATSGLA